MFKRILVQVISLRVVHLCFPNVGVALSTQALHGHISTGQSKAADDLAAATESGHAGEELVYLQVRSFVGRFPFAEMEAKGCNFSRVHLRA